MKVHITRFYLLRDDIEHLGPEVDGGELVNAREDEVEAGRLGPARLDPAQAEDDRSLVLLDYLEDSDSDYEMKELTLKQTQRDQGSVTSTSTQEEKISSQPQRPGPWGLECSGEEPGHQIR